MADTTKVHSGNKYATCAEIRNPDHQLPLVISGKPKLNIDPLRVVQLPSGNVKRGCCSFSVVPSYPYQASSQHCNENGGASLNCTVVCIEPSKHGVAAVMKLIRHLAVDL